MLIKDSAIVIDGHDIKFDAAYLEVFHIIEDLVYVATAPGISGNGHIILKHQHFYGLHGTCTLYFQKGVFIYMSVQPDWSMYSLDNCNGHRLPANVILSTAVSNNERVLKNHLDFIGKPTRENSVFKKDNIYVITGIARKDEQYSVIIKPAKTDLVQLAEKTGYALASKQLVENQMKVCFMYRESPDNSSDSGWRFLSGHEDDKYVQNPDNIGLYSIKTIAEIDPDIIPFLNSPIGAIFARKDDKSPLLACINNK